MKEVKSRMQQLLATTKREAWVGLIASAPRVFGLTKNDLSDDAATRGGFGSLSLLSS